MNYSGKFDGKSSVDGSDAPHNPHIHVDSVSAHGTPPGAIIVQDAQLLFNGDFKRSGLDLILSKDDHELVLQDYFKGEKRAALSSPDGAHLTGDIINALTGHQQFAQADGSASVAKVIGHVSKLVGTATVIRNGVSVILNNGDNVNKGDVVQAGSNSTLGITFIDGTVFGLSSNARMVLNEMVYDPNGSNNSSLLSLVAGTISFVAGETAKHGDMKIDTPVATMGIRGTACLIEIDFDVPAQGGLPAAKFQVLVEPDGTTGRYVLLDKLTQLPIATVDQAGVVKSISQGILDSYSAPLSPEAQKLVTDLFALKFTNVQDPNPKTTTAQTDSINQGATQIVRVAIEAFDTKPPVALPPGKTTTTTGTTGPGESTSHIPGPPTVAVFGGALAERISLTASSTVDAASGTILFADLNKGDTPTAKTTFNSFTYQNAQHDDITATLTAEQLAAITAVEVPLAVVPDPANTNNGFATWTYSVADGAFDFLAVGETLTLTYVAEVNNNFAPNNEKTLKPFAIAITGTNDAPTIAATGGGITERIGTGNTVTDTASGIVTFADVDLTDRPVVSANFSSFKYIDAQGHDVTATLTAEQIAAVLAVEIPLAITQAAGNTNNGSATWTYSLTDQAFDFLADGETLVLNYIAQVDDGHGGIITTPISVSINGADVTVNGTNDVPVVSTTSNAFTELAGTSNATADTVSGTIGFTDVDLTDRPVASAAFTSFTYTDAAHHALTLTAQQLADVEAVAVPLSVVQAAGNTNNGSATWTYNLADSNFDFLAAGQILTLTYTATVDDGHGGVVTKPFTVTITGTNDAPTIAATSSGITERIGTGNTVTDTASGTVTFADVDLTDRPVVSANFSSFKYIDAHGHDVTLTLTAAQIAAVMAVEVPLAVTQAAGNTSNGSATWSYSLTDAAFDFLADGETLILNYVAQVDDGHGGIVTTPISVSFNGADVTVNGTNDVPTIVTASTVATGAVTEDAAALLSAGGTITYQDVDLTDTHTAAFVLKSSDASANLPGYSESAPLSQIGTFALGTVNENNANTINIGSLGWTFTLDDSNPVLQSLAVGQTITQVYTVTLDDHHGGTVTQDVTVVITGTNDAPLVTSASGDTACADLPETNAGLTAQGTATVIDPDVIDSVTVSISGVLVDGPTGGLTACDFLSYFTVPATAVLDGSSTSSHFAWNFDSHGQAFDFLAAGQTLSLHYTIVPNDFHAPAGTGTGVVTINITGTNDAPEFSGHNLAATFAPCDDPVSIANNVSASDIDSANYAGGSLTATVTLGGHEGDTLSIADSQYISVVGNTVWFDSDGDGPGLPVAVGTLTSNCNTLTVTLNDNASDAAIAELTKAIQFENTRPDPICGTRTVTFTLDDGGGTANGGHSSDFFTATVDVTGVNDAPSITGDLAVVTVKGSGVQLTGIATATATADLQAVDPDSTPDQLIFTVTCTSHGHIAASATGCAITSFTQAQLNSGSVFFVADSPTYVGQGSFTVTLSDGVAAAPTPMTVGVTIVDAEFRVLTTGGYDFDQDNSIGAMGSGVVSAVTPTTFTISNVAANRDFIFTGSGFLYNAGLHAFTGGTITSILEVTHDASHTPLASFGLNVSAAAWYAATVAKATGDNGPIEALTHDWTFNFIGNGGADAFAAADLNDIFTGRGGNDTLVGEFGYDRANYGNATGAISVHLAGDLAHGGGFVTGDESVGTDILQSIELVTGSNYADTFDATGFSAVSPNAGSTVTANVAGLFNEFEGRGGNDLITGNGSTRISYLHATAGVIVTFDDWTSLTSGASGTATGDASTGTDSFTGVYSVRGSNFGDVFHGSNNPLGSSENFEGMGGDDQIYGGGGFDRAVYNLTHDGIGIDIKLADGTVTDLPGGTDVGHDTLHSVEAVWGTEFADIYNAGATINNPGGFGATSTNAGSFAGFNEFEGGGGDDIITGNGNTRVAYYHATGGVVVTLGSGGTGESFGNSSVGHDHFNGGVNSVIGSEFNDVITGNGGNNTLEGRGGNDILSGNGGDDTLIGGGGSDQFVFKTSLGSTGNDTVNDFTAGQDHIELDYAAFNSSDPNSFNAWLASHATASGSDLLIDLNVDGLHPNQDTILLKNVALASLHANDFVLPSNIA